MTRPSFFRIALATVFIVAALVRLTPMSVFLAGGPKDARAATYNADARGYKDFALQIYHQGLGSLAHDTTDHTQKAPVTAFRTPLYPMFIAAVFSLFRTQQPEPVLFVQILLDLCTLWLVYLIVRRLAPSRWIALGAAALYALDPLSVMYASSMYAECFFTFFAAAGIYAFLKAVDARTVRDRRWRLAFLGIVIGLAALAKPVGVYAVAAYIVALIIEYRLHKHPWKETALAAAIVFAAFAATVAPWQLRNFLVYGHYALTFQQGREILVWRVGTCRAMFENVPSKQMIADIQAPYSSIPDYYERSKAEQAEAVAYIGSHPMNMLACHLGGLRRFFFTGDLFLGDRTGGAASVARSLLNTIADPIREVGSKLYQVSQYAGYVLAAIGAVALFIDRRRRSALILLAGLVFYISQASSVDGYSRYAVPIQPILVALVAVGAAFIIHRYGRTIRGIL